jgi:glycosyltransferase involved in cell wall biosynthesis
MPTNPPAPTAHAKVRLAYVVSHPIQYQAPLLRRIAQQPDIDLKVFFGSDFSARSYHDEGFGVSVAWDVPLLEGYRSVVLPRLRDNGTVTATTPLSRGILGRLRNPDGSAAFDALWVHGYASLNSLQAILAAKLLGIPVLLRAESWLGDRPRSAWKQWLKGVLLHDLRHYIAATLPIGTANARYWTHYFGHDMPQFRMPYAVDNVAFAERAAASSEAQAELRSSLQLEPGRPVVLFASKLQTRKRCSDLIEACAALSRSSAPQSIERKPYLLIAGDGEERSALEARAVALGMDNVRFLGFQNQASLAALFSLSSVFVLPARHEPWGLIVNEAMACGCPVIASSDIASAFDLLRDGAGEPAGIVYPVGDIAALTAALARTLASPQVAQAMGQAARERIASWSFDQDIQGLRSALAATTRKIRA